MDADRAATPRLSPRTLAALPRDIARPAYDRAAQAIGIVHFGIGAFHRAHQAAFTDAAMNGGDRDWAIAGVSLRSAAVRDQMAPQDGLYSVVERGDTGEDVRVMGAVRALWTGGTDGETIVDRLAAPETRILSFTITEKGYHRGLDGDLDFSAPAIRNDRRPDAPPQSIYGFLRRGLARRRDAKLPGLTLLSCDNLAGNGQVLRAMLLAFLEACDRELAGWVAAECTMPSTMVDRIVPATMPADLDALAARTGLRDEAAVITEPFRQWVIEDRFAGPRPRWEAAGAELVGDVHGHELAKLRMLNGAHSALAYLGLLGGYDFVHEAIADPAIRGVIETLMRDEAASTLPRMAGFDADAYAMRLLGRFGNRRLPHSLAQIAMDGTQKIPQRWFATMNDRAALGGDTPAILQALAAWILFVRGDRFAVADPLADRLKTTWEQVGRQDIVSALFGESGLFAASWRSRPQDRDALRRLVAARPFA